jgi:hypothetical protein
MGLNTRQSNILEDEILNDPTEDEPIDIFPIGIFQDDPAPPFSLFNIVYNIVRWWILPYKYWWPCMGICWKYYAIDYPLNFLEFVLFVGGGYLEGVMYFGIIGVILFTVSFIGFLKRY